MQRKATFTTASGGQRVTNGHATAVFSHTPNEMVRRHDFGIVPLYPSNASSFPRINDQTQSGGLGEEFTKGAAPAPATATPTTDLNMGEGETEATTTPVIDSVELVSSTTGAVGGYPDKEDTCDASLSKPGPFNDLAFKGSVANVHQIHFHVSQGNPGDLRATRMVNRTAVGRGQPFPKSGNDGPPDHEYKYTKDKMVIADAPGWCSTLKETDFPVSYSGDFALYAWDAPTKQILASIAYHVEIKKAHFSDGGATNTVSVTDKKIGGVVPSPVKPKK
jgi:hypothetical protein